MDNEILKFFRMQRQIFGICPNSGRFFRLSDCKIYLKGRPAADWMDKLEAEEQKLDRYKEKTDDMEDELRQVAREKGQRQAASKIRKIDPLFRPRRLDPDDAKVIFHPVDYLVFKGMKNGGAISKLVFLDRETKSKEHRRLQDSIEKVIAKERYDWVTLRVGEDGSVVEE